MIKCSLLPLHRCPDCEEFTTSWERVADELKDNVTVADLDCASYNKACKAFVVKNFPTFVWIEDGEIVESLGKEMSVQELVSYAKRKISLRLKREVTEIESLEAAKSEGLKVIEVEKTEGFSDNITEILGKDFVSTIATGYTLVIFCVPWCNYCQSTLSTMLNLQTHFSYVPTFKIAKLDCSKEENADTCFVELSNGVPTVNLYVNGKLTVADYHGLSSEELEDMIKSNIDGNSSEVEGWQQREKDRKKKRKEEKREERDQQHHQHE